MRLWLSRRALTPGWRGDIWFQLWRLWRKLVLVAAVAIAIGCSSIPMEDCERRCWSKELHDSVLAECDEVPVTDYTSPGKCQLAENIRYHGCRSRCE